MTTTEQIKAEYAEKLAAAEQVAIKERYEARLENFVKMVGPVGIEKLRLVEALRGIAFKLQIEAEREGMW